MVVPDLSVVISTHHRPGPLREAIAAIVAQDHPGVIETLVVFDKEEPDTSLDSADPQRPVRVLANHRTARLPGSRNRPSLERVDCCALPPATTRLPFAAAVLAGVPAERVMATLNRVGRGI